MTQDLDISKLRVAIFGLGLMGGSFAYSIQGKVAHVLGIDPDLKILKLAKRENIVDEIAATPDENISSADLIILAAPVKKILNLLDTIASLHKGSPVVIDFGSTKVEIVNAMQQLPKRFDPIGGHPMCGKEKSSLTNAEASLYQGSTFALIPLKRTSNRAKELAENLVSAIGANPLWIDAETHDRLVAITSHGPYLLSNALASISPAAAKPLVGTGFQSTSRLAGSSPEMMIDIVETNRENILNVIGSLKKQIFNIEQSINEREWEKLYNILSIGRNKYKELTSKYEEARD